MSWRAVNDEAPYRKVSKQSEGLEGFLRGDTVKVEASQDPGAKKGGLDRTVSALSQAETPKVFGFCFSGNFGLLLFIHRQPFFFSNFWEQKNCTSTGKSGA